MASQASACCNLCLDKVVNIRDIGGHQVNAKQRVVHLLLHPEKVAVHPTSKDRSASSSSSHKATHPVEANSKAKYGSMSKSKPEGISISDGRDDCPIQDASSPAVEIFVRKGFVFRSAEPSLATAEDREVLLGTYGIRSLLDFRMKSERKNSEGPTSLERYFTMVRAHDHHKHHASHKLPHSHSAAHHHHHHKADPFQHQKDEEKKEEEQEKEKLSSGSSSSVQQPHAKLTQRRLSVPGRLEMLSAAQSSEESEGDISPLTTHPPTAIPFTPVFPSSANPSSSSSSSLFEGKEKETERAAHKFKPAEDPDRPHRRLFPVPLINRSYFYGLYTSASWAVRIKFFVLLNLLCKKHDAFFLLLTHLNDIGLVGMYKLFIERSKTQFLQVFRILKNKNNYPILGFCSLGKDRTGCVMAMLLSVLGVPRDEILNDYAETEKHIISHLETVRPKMTRMGLVKDEFALAPKDVMRQLLEFIDSKYGSVEGYLESIGFSRAEQDELRMAMLEVRYIEQKKESPIPQSPSSPPAISRL